MGRYRKKPVEIDAMQWTGENVTDILTFCPTASRVSPTYLAIPTLEGRMTARVGDWIIRGIKGEYYPCQEDIFRETYDSASGNGGKVQA